MTAKAAYKLGYISHEEFLKLRKEFLKCKGES